MRAGTAAIPRTPTVLAMALFACIGAAILLQPPNAVGVRPSALAASAQPLSLELEKNVMELKQLMILPVRSAEPELYVRGRVAALAERIGDIAGELEELSRDELPSSEYAIAESYYHQRAPEEGTGIDTDQQ